MKTHIIFIITSLLAILLSSSIAYSDNYELRFEAAVKYSKVAPLSKLLDDTYKNIAKQLPQDQREEFLQKISSLVDVNKLEQTIIELMAKHFTTEELNALAEFYGSPQGQSIMNKFGAYMADTQIIIIQEISNAMKNIQNKDN